MSTIIAFKDRKEIIMASDLQITSSIIHTEATNPCKLFEFANNIVIGAVGSYNIIEFLEYARVKSLFTHNVKVSEAFCIYDFVREKLLKSFKEYCKDYDLKKYPISLIIKQGQRLWQYDSDDDTIQESEFIIIGSASLIIRGAMECIKKSNLKRELAPLGIAKFLLEIASDIDPYTGSKFDTRIYKAIS